MRSRPSSGETLIDTTFKYAPYISLRHARAGRVGGEGCLPPGWGGELTSGVNVLDVNLAGGKPSIVVSLNFNADTAGEYAGLCVGQYLSAPKDAVVVLALVVVITKPVNVGAASMVVREWEEGGEFACQSTRPLALRDTPQIGIVAHQVRGEARVTQPALMLKRLPGAPGSLTITLRGLAFGNLYDHPRWLWG